jgi:hypothetical protein
VLTALAFSNNDLGDEGAKAIGDALHVNSALTSLNLLRNNLDTASANALAEVAKTKRISLCGIKPNQTEADFCGWGLKPADAVLLASDLSLTNVSSVLTSLNLANNHLGADGAKAIANALGVNSVLTSLDTRINEIGG